MTNSMLHINSDVGEGFTNEEKIFPFISSCNIACGGHTGTVETMNKTVVLAKKFNVNIGAHPSYPDTDNFGRKSIVISPMDLIKSIQEQILNLVNILNKHKVELHHIKPHGALYNDIAKNQSLSLTFLDAIKEYKQKTYLYVPYGSVVAKNAIEKGFKIKYEAFLDRNYENDLTLVKRSNLNAVIQKSEDVLSHLLSIVNNEIVLSITGEKISIKADTFCVHSDTPSVFNILKYLSEELPKYSISIKNE